MLLQNPSFVAFYDIWPTLTTSEAAVGRKKCLLVKENEIIKLQWEMVGTCMWHVCDSDAEVLSESRHVTWLSVGADADWSHVGVYEGPSQDCRRQTLLSLLSHAAQSQHALCWWLSELGHYLYHMINISVTDIRWWKNTTHRKQLEWIITAKHRNLSFHMCAKQNSSNSATRERWLVPAYDMSVTAMQRYWQ